MLQTEPPVQQEETLKNKFLTFTIGKESSGIEIRYVEEMDNLCSAI